MRFGGLLGLIVLLPVPAIADRMTAIRPGLMCTSATVLAVLTLPDGNNRAASVLAKPGDAALEIKGGCINIPHGAKVNVQTRRRNTSVVTFDAGRGLQTFYVPNIDFVVATSGSVQAPACLPYDRPVKLIGTITIGKAYGEDDKGVVGWSHWQQITLLKPICTIADEANDEDPKTNIKDVQYYSDNHVSEQFHLGEQITFVGKLDPAMTSNTWYTAVYVDIQAVLAN